MLVSTFQLTLFIQEIPKQILLQTVKERYLVGASKMQICVFVCFMSSAHFAREVITEKMDVNKKLSNALLETEDGIF